MAVALGYRLLRLLGHGVPEAQEPEVRNVLLRETVVSFRGKLLPYRALNGVWRDVIGHGNAPLGVSHRASLRFGRNGIRGVR